MSNPDPLLELYLTPLDAQQFRIIIAQSSQGIDGDGDSRLPFWQGDKDWQTTIIKTLELNRGFKPEAFPLTDEQDWLVITNLLSPDRQSFHPTYLEQIGQALYHALFPPGKIRQGLETALRLAEANNAVLHIRLKFPADAPTRSRLTDYPWELIHDGQRFLEHRLVRISRYIAYEALPPKLLPNKQLHVVLISPQASDPSQGLNQLPDLEQQAIRRGLTTAAADGRITLTQLPTATWQALSNTLTQTPIATPSILHFDGHGLFGKRCANPRCSQIHPGIKTIHCQKCGQVLPEPQGFLLFESQQGGADYISATSLAALLPPDICLVVLSACQSGMALAGNSVLNGIAQQLIDARIPAVVAMQYAVEVQAASQFTEQFYRVLGTGRSLLDAVQEGRTWMGVEGNQWYRPVLYLRWRDNQGGQLFEQTNAASPSGLSRFQRLELERWQTELSDLDQDYQSVQAQLRTEQDAPTRNKLERQLQQIGQQMDTKEQQISQLLRLSQNP